MANTCTSKMISTYITLTKCMVEHKYNLPRYKIKKRVPREFINVLIVLWPLGASMLAQYKNGVDKQKASVHWLHYYTTYN